MPAGEAKKRNRLREKRRLKESHWSLRRHYPDQVKRSGYQENPSQPGSTELPYSRAHDRISRRTLQQAKGGEASGLFAAETACQYVAVAMAAFEVFAEADEKFSEQEKIFIGFLLKAAVEENDESLSPGFFEHFTPPFF